MRYIGWRWIVLPCLALVVMLFGAACDPQDTAGLATVDKIADDLIEEGKTLHAPTDTPAPPTDTPIPPTDTPVPTPTEVKVSMQDEEGDCEALAGAVSEEGCQVDLGSFAMLPCENPGFYTFKVDFYSLKEAATINVCFLIDGDGDPETGFEDQGFSGIDSVYCYVSETGEVIVSSYGADGSQLDATTVANPYSYLISDPEMIAAERQLRMTYPPAEIGSVVIASDARVAAEGLYYDMDGNMVYDVTQPIELYACPGG